MDRWVKSYIKIFSSEIFEDSEMFRTFCYLFHFAAVKPWKKKGVDIKRGQYVSSLRHLAEFELKRNSRTVKKALDGLVRCGAITIDSSRKDFTIYTIVNYNKYQGSNVTPSVAQNTTPQESSVVLSTTPSVAQNTTPSVALSTTHNIEYNNRDNIESSSSACVRACESASEFRERMIRSMLGDERWLEYTEQYVRLPKDVIVEEVKRFKLRMDITNDQNNDETTLKNRIVGWLGEAKRRMDTEKFKTNEHRTDNNGGINPGCNERGFPTGNPYFEWLDEYCREKGF